jgi:cholesterol transport system auxiliary component
MKTMKVLFAAAALLPLAGCFGGKAPSQLLTLHAAATPPIAQPRTGREGNIITVTAPTLPHALNNNRVAVYVTPTTVEYVKEGQWADKPNEMFRLLLSETMAARSGWVVVDPSVYTQVQGVVLGGQLLRFGYDPTSGEAVVLFEASLARPSQAVSTNRFEARVASTADSLAVANALNQAANQVAGQVADWVGR